MFWLSAAVADCASAEFVLCFDETARNRTVIADSAASAVLGMFLGQLCKYCQEEHGICHEVDEFWVYEFAQIWNCDQKTSNHRVHEFFKSKHFRDGIPVIPGTACLLASVWF